MLALWSSLRFLTLSLWTGSPLKKNSPVQAPSSMPMMLRRVDFEIDSAQEIEAVGTGFDGFFQIAHVNDGFHDGCQPLCWLCVTREGKSRFPAQNPRGERQCRLRPCTVSILEVFAGIDAITIRTAKLAAGPLGMRGAPGDSTRGRPPPRGAEEGRPERRGRWLLHRRTNRKAREP